MATSAATSVRASRARAPWVGLAVALGLMFLAMTVPRLFSWEVNALHFPPLTGVWYPRLGPGTLPAVALGMLGVGYGMRLAESLRWPALLGVVFVVGIGWLVSLATVSGRAGIGAVLNDGNEYLQTARAMGDVSTALHDYTERIPLHSPDHWAVHVAGHPPGALLFFVLLVRLGLGSGLAAGSVVLVLAATTPVAVLVTLRRLGAEQAARRAAPFLVLGPAAIWSAVSADAVFAACAAWGLCCLAVSATSPSRARMAAWAAAAGLLLGLCVMLSYGLVLLGILAVAVLFAARSARAFPWAVASALVVVLAFAAVGFSWWEAFPVLHERYVEGIAGTRPASYWLWGNLAALAFSAGPLVGAAVATSVQHLARARSLRELGPARPVVVLVTAAMLTIAVADLSLLSKAETERIWLPFVPWLLVGCALLSPRWRRYGLGLQVVVALAVQSLLYTPW